MHSTDKNIAIPRQSAITERSGGKVLFVDRQGATSIWTLMAAIGAQLENTGWKSGFVAMSDESGLQVPEMTCSLGSFNVSVPHKRWPGDLLRQQAAFSKQFSEILANLRPDVVHVNFAIPGIWARRIAHRCGVPFIISTQHELAGSLSPHLRLGLWATERYVNVHTYVSEAVAKSFDRLPVDNATEYESPPPHIVIRNGVDERALRHAANNPATVVSGRIVAPGRLMPEKGQALLIESLAAIKNAKPDAHLILAGSGPDEQRLRALARRFGVEASVQFSGWLPQKALWHLLTSSQVAAFPSDGHQEGFGLALAEAALLGVSIAASDISAFREVLANDDSAAYWCEPKQLLNWCKALETALSYQVSEQQAMTKQAMHNVRQRACMSHMLHKYTQLYALLAKFGG